MKFTATDTTTHYLLTTTNDPLSSRFVSQPRRVRVVSTEPQRPTYRDFKGVVHERTTEPKRCVDVVFLDPRTGKPLGPQSNNRVSLRNIRAPWTEYEERLAFLKAADERRREASIERSRLANDLEKRVAQAKRDLEANDRNPSDISVSYAVRSSGVTISGDLLDFLLEAIARDQL